MSRLVFVRHGESTANASRTLSGWIDVDLTPRGIEQASALRPALEELAAARAFDRRVSSDLRRAVRTAELAWPRPVPRLERHPELRERDVGEFEGLSLDPLRADGRADALLRWTGGPPGGEDLRTLSLRLLAWFEAHDDGSRMLVVVHGGVIRCLLGLLDGAPTDRIGSIRVANTQVEPRDVDPSRWAELRASVSG